MPAYRDDIWDAAMPLFSADNNARSRTGMCVNLDVVPCDLSLGRRDEFGNCSFPNCPIPCNPTWSAQDIELVCGPDRSCCQTVVLEPEDCLLEDGVWRPVTGRDVPQRTAWRLEDHATHQDPGMVACTDLAGSSSLSNADFRSCVDQLTVANQRGYCMPSCPVADVQQTNSCARLHEGSEARR